MGNAGLVSIHITKEEGKDPVVTCSTGPPALGPQGYEVQCSGPEVPDDGISNIKFTATVVRAAPTAPSLTTVPALMLPTSPYHVQLRWEKGVEHNVGITLPGILSCMNIPDPSIKTNDLKLNPVFTNMACSADGKTYGGKESHGLLVYDPPTCDGWFHKNVFPKKGCPNAGLVTIHITKEEGKDPMVRCSTLPPALGQQGYEVQCSGPEVPDDGRSNIKFTATVVRRAPVASSLTTVPALMQPSSPYHVQLRYETGVGAKVGIIVPGILSCMNIPDPSIKTNDLKLNPVFTNMACSADGKTYRGKESHGLIVYDPPNCDGFFHKNVFPKKGCPNAGTVTIHITKEEGKDPVVTCSTLPPALGPQGYEVRCSGPQAQDDGRSNVKFTATVVKSEQALFVV